MNNLIHAASCFKSPPRNVNLVYDVLSNVFVIADILDRSPRLLIFIIIMKTDFSRIE